MQCDTKSHGVTHQNTTIFPSPFSNEVLHAVLTSHTNTNFPALPYLISAPNVIWIRVQITIDCIAVAILVTGGGRRVCRLPCQGAANILISHSSRRDGYC